MKSAKYQQYFQTYGNDFSHLKVAPILKISMVALEKNANFDRFANHLLSLMRDH
jgi:hypothetical protein